MWPFVDLRDLPGIPLNLWSFYVLLNQSLLSWFNTNRNHSNKLPFPLGVMTTWRIHPLMRITMRVFQIMTSSLAGERPPPALLILNPASVHCPCAFLTVKSTFEVRFFSYSKPPKEVSVNRNLLSLWDISFQRKLRWMTGTPASPVEPRYWPEDPKVSGSRLERADQVLRGGDSQMQICSRVSGIFLKGPNRQKCSCVIFVPAILLLCLSRT